MKKAPDFASIFTEQLKEYVEFMIDNGRRFGVETTILKAFDRYMCDHDITLIAENAVMDFSFSVPDLTKEQYAKRHRVVRKFADYMSLKGKCETVRSLPKGKSNGRIVPHIYTDKELILLLETAQQINPVPKLRPHTFYSLLGLLASTGIRVSEGINLDISDVDFDSGVLKIRNTKFKKSRLVPIHPTTLEVLRNYDTLRRELIFDPKDNAFFISKFKKRLTYATVNATFLQIVRSAGIRNTEGKGSRIHDLRHTFAVRRVSVWYDMGLDIHQMLPLLSTYMGHAHFEDTTYYLSAGAELLAKGAIRFVKGGDTIA